MFTPTLKRKTRLVALAAASAIALPLLSSQPAQADPRQHTDQLVGVGSDTIQDILNAFAGETADIYYTPLHTTSATGTTRLQFSSWNAVAPDDHTELTCISPRALFNAFQRPNGSSNGRAALSRALDGTGYVNTGGDPACNNKPTAGIVDFARSSSSSVQTVTGVNTLTYIPFAKDALGYAYANAGSAPTAPITDLTQGELQTIFTGAGSGSTIRGKLIIPCDIQHGSGTQKDWPGKVGGAATGTTIDTAANACDAINIAGDDTFGRLQEHKSDQLADKAAGYGGTNAQFIVGMGVSGFIAQQNGVAPDHTAATVDMGDIGALSPYDGTLPGTISANAAFYGSSFGRSVFTVWPKSVVNDIGYDDVKALVVGSTSKVCSATATITAFGFLSLGAGCGTVTLESGPWVNQP